MKRSIFGTLTLSCVLLIFISSGHGSGQTCKGLYSEAVILCDQGQWTDAARVAKMALKKAEPAQGSQRVHTLRSLRLLDKVQRERGNLLEARKFCTPAHTVCLALYGNAHPSSVRSLVALGDLSAREGKYSEAESYYRAAVKSGAQAGSVADLEVASALVGLAAIYRTDGKNQEARKLYEQALEAYDMSRKYRPALNEPAADILCNLGDMDKDRGNFPFAAESYRRAIEKFTMLAGSENVKTADARMRLADLYVRWGKPVRAERQYKKAVATYRNVGGNEIKSAIAMKCIGDLQSERGNWELAERYYTKSMMTLSDCSPSCDLTLATVMKALADLKMRRGDHARAIPVYGKILARLNVDSGQK